MKNKIICLIIILLLTFNFQVLSEETKKNENENELITLKIGENINGLKATYIEITYDQTQKIMDKLIILKQKLDKNEITDLAYFNEFIKIFQDENILSKNCNLNNMIEISNLINQNISIEKSIDKISDESNKKLLNNELPIHIGKRTIIASLGIGNYLVRRIIPIKPYGFIDVINREILRKYNLTSTFSYAAACMWTPGPRGYHVLHSLNPIVGLEDFSKKTFNSKAIGGIFLLGLNISLEAFSKDRSKVYFDATIGIYGADLMIGF
jgi:hypothetical protein